MRFRQILFWVHLGAGLIAGAVIAIMSFTGVVLAFEKQIIAWAERDSRTVAVPLGAERLPLDDLLNQVREQRPGPRPSGITIRSDAGSTVLLSLGRTNSFYVNPFTADILPERGQGTRRLMQWMLSWHRFLGRSDEHRAVGKAITGVCNAAFLVLAVTGLYLWWPRKRMRDAFRSVTRMRFNLAGRARDWNWHNVIGFWTAPVLIVLTLTAFPISFRWAGDLIYRVTGSQPPPAQGAGSAGAGAPGVEIPPAAADARPASLATLLASALEAVPDWKEVSIRTTAGGRGGRAASNPSAVDSGVLPQVQPVGVTVRQHGAWPRFASVQLTLDPFTGSVLRKEMFSDFNLGRKVRSWTRFLHTGEALGLGGQLVAGLASLLALVLVWTGFALSWRRFFGRKQPPTVDSPQTVA